MINRCQNRIELYLLVITFTILMSCGFLSDSSKKNGDMEVSEDKKEEQKESIGDYVDNYTITPNYEHPRFKELMTEFEKQKHRFEIDTCEFKYNGKSFFLGDSPQDVFNVFGKPKAERVYTVDKKTYSFSYEKLNLLFRFESSSDLLVNYWLYLSDHNGHENTPYKIIKLRGVPYHLDMKLNDFMELSDLDHNKLRRSNRTFFMLQRECPPSEFSRIYTPIGSNASYESIGSGHLTHTGDFDPKTSSPIERLSISISTLEKFKK